MFFDDAPANINLDSDSPTPKDINPPTPSCPSTPIGPTSADPVEPTNEIEREEPEVPDQSSLTTPLSRRSQREAHPPKQWWYQKASVASNDEYDFGLNANLADEPANHNEAIKQSSNHLKHTSGDQQWKKSTAL